MATAAAASENPPRWGNEINTGVCSSARGPGDVQVSLCGPEGQCFVDIETRPDGSGSVRLASFDGAGCCRCDCPGVPADVVAALKAARAAGGGAGGLDLPTVQAGVAAAVGAAAGTIEDVWHEDFRNYGML